MTRDLIETFLRTMSEAIDRARAGLASGAAEQVTAAAHSCFGSSATLGLNSLSPTLRALEQAARNRRVPEIRRLISDWEREFQRVKEMLVARKQP